MKRRRIMLVALAVVVALLTIVWYGDLPSAFALDVFGSGGDEPLLQPAGSAVREAEARLAWSGGVPHDAVLGRITAQRRTAFFPDGRSSPVMVTGYSLEYAPRGAMSIRDRILVQVGAGTIERCLDGGTLPPRGSSRQNTPWTCGHYALAFSLRVESLWRTWRPWPVRAVAGWWQRSFGPQVAMPATVHATCGNRVDVAAVRRILAAIESPIVLKGSTPWGRPWDRDHPWESARAVAGDREAATVTWAPPYPTVPAWPPDRPRAPIREAIVVDGMLQDVAERAVLVRGRLQPRKVDVAAMVTTDYEPVCPPLREPAVTANVPPPPPSWDAIEAIVAERAQDEARWRTFYRPPVAVSSVTAGERHPGAISTIDVDTRQGTERWRARFTIDEREPAIREAEFTRR